MSGITVVNLERSAITVLESRAGRQGAQGPQGARGEPGLSAFQLWLLQSGNDGKTMNDFYAAQVPITVIDGGNF